MDGKEHARENVALLAAKRDTVKQRHVQAGYATGRKGRFCRHRRKRLCPQG